MNFNEDRQVLIQERSLVSTMIKGRPHRNSAWMAFGTILIIVFVTVFYWQDPFGWSKLMPAVNSKVFIDGEWWRIFTATLIHADIGHLISNMYMLGIFSFFVYGYFGSAVYPTSSFLAAAVVNAIAISTYPLEVRLLGASGMVYVLGGFWLTIYFLIQRQYRIFNRILRVAGIGLIIFFPSTFAPLTSYRTHAIGFAMGIVFALLYFFINKNKIRAHEVYETSLVESEPVFH